MILIKGMRDSCTIWADVSYEYFDAAADYDYYRLNIKYPVKSRLFGLNKLCDYKALVRVEMAV